MTGSSNIQSFEEHPYNTYLNDGHFANFARALSLADLKSVDAIVLEGREIPLDAFREDICAIRRGVNGFGHERLSRQLTYLIASSPLHGKAHKNIAGERYENVLKYLDLLKSLSEDANSEIVDSLKLEASAKLLSMMPAYEADLFLKMHPFGSRPRSHKEYYM